MARKELFTLPPRSVSIPGGKPRLSMMDRHIAAIRAEQERNAAQIRTREELYEDLTNFHFVHEVDEYGLPFSTPYHVPDSIPDVLSMPKEDSSETPQKNSLSKEDSDKESSGGSE